MLRKPGEARTFSATTTSRRKAAEIEKPDDIIRKFSRKTANRKCADCSAKMPGYVDLTHYLFVCVACAGIHREFNHRIKGVGHSSFTAEEASILTTKGGNEVVNAKYLKHYTTLRERLRPPDGSVSTVEDQLLRVWIRRKYIDKAWYDETADAASAANSQSVGVGVGVGSSSSTSSRSTFTNRPTKVSLPPKKSKSAPVTTTAPATDLFGGMFDDNNVTTTSNTTTTTTTKSKSNNDDDAWDAFGKTRTSNAGGDDLFATTNATNTSAFQADFNQMQPQQPPPPPPTPPQQPEPVFDPRASQQQTIPDASPSSPPPLPPQMSPPQLTNANMPSPPLVNGNANANANIAQQPSPQQQQGVSMSFNTGFPQQGQGNQQQQQQMQQQQMQPQMNGNMMQTSISTMPSPSPVTQQPNGMAQTQMNTNNNGFNNMSMNMNTDINTNTNMNMNMNNPSVAMEQAQTQSTSIMGGMTNANDAFDAFSDLSLLSSNKDKKSTENAFSNISNEVKKEETMTQTQTQMQMQQNQTQIPSHGMSMNNGGGAPSIPTATVTAGPKYRKGQCVTYRDNQGNLSPAEIAKVHLDDNLVPFYDIKMADGREKQTDDAHLQDATAMAGPAMNGNMSSIPNKTEKLRVVTSMMNGMTFEQLIKVENFIKTMTL